MLTATLTLALFTVWLPLLTGSPSYLALANILAFGWLVRRDHHQWPSLLAGFLAGDFLALAIAGNTMLFSTASALADTAGVTLGSLLVSKFAKISFEPLSFKSILIIFGCSLLVVAPLPAFTYALLQEGQSPARLIPNFVDRWLSLTVGTFLLVPLAISFGRSDVKRWLQWKPLVVRVMAFMLFASFSVLMLASNPTPFVFISLPLTILAIIFGPKDSVVIAIATLAVWGAGALQEWWPVPLFVASGYIKQTWLASAFASFYPFMVGTIAEHMREKEQRLARASQTISAQELLLKQFFENAPIGIARISSEGQFLDSNAALRGILGYADKIPETFSIKNFAFEGNSSESDIALLASLAEKKAFAIKSHRNINDRKISIRMRALHCSAPHTNSFYWLLVEDITKEQEALKALEAEKLKAESSTRAKTAFVANISHEIRTPMTAVLGIAQLLAKSRLDELQQQHVAMIQSAGQNLMRLLNDVLDFSKIEAGHMELINEPFSLEELLSNLRNLLEIESKKKGLSSHFQLPASPLPYVCGDSVRIQQLLTNLIGNAIKFTEQGCISFTLEIAAPSKTQMELRFTVKDTGIGISESQRERIFEAFNQADSTITRRFGGTGLGLAICKNIADLMNGTLSVSSTPDIGSEFLFRVILPVLNPAATEKTSTKTDEKSTSSLVTAEKRLQGIHVLLTEDDEAIRTVASALLKHEGAIVTLAHSGQEAINLLTQKTNPVDIVLMDVQMPGMDGCETTRNLQAIHHIDTPVIALTAGVMQSEQKNCRDAGMCDVIAKPLDLDAAVNTILQHISKKSSPALSAPATQFDNESSVESVFDIQYLLDTIGDEFSELENIAEMVRRLVQSLPQTLDQAHNAIKLQQHQLAAAVFHKMRGSVSTLGARQLISLSREMERALLNKETESIEKLLPELDRAVAALITQARQWLNRPKDNDSTRLQA